MAIASEKLPVLKIGSPTQPVPPGTYSVARSFDDEGIAFTVADFVLSAALGAVSCAMATLVSASAKTNTKDPN